MCAGKYLEREREREGERERERATPLFHYYFTDYDSYNNYKLSLTFMSPSGVRKSGLDLARSAVEICFLKEGGWKGWASSK